MSRTRYRALFACLLLAPVALAVFLLARVFAAGGLSWSEVGLLALYGLLLTWIGTGFWFCVFGLFARPARLTAECASAADGRRGLGPSLTAVVMPVYHEDPAAVFARIRVMYASLQRTGHLNSFEFFVLSDSRNPQCWSEETRCWFDACRELEAFHRLFYRRRADNHARKSGNVEEFCRNWGGRYDYMVVLDADSLMSGDTMVEMVRRMEADPRLGLLQTSPVTVRGASLFARLQQFAGGLYGDLLTRGLSRFLGTEGTYWGHNAIIRMRAFARCCALPPLPGRQPLGGLIMSHDFVEAALLVAAGWRVRFDPDLGGSYEEGPPSLIDHAARDRRWCQGNLQHAYLLLAKRLHGMSRLNFLAGIMSYVSGPLWLAFIGLSLWATLGASGSNLIGGWQTDRAALLSVLGITATLLFGSKLVSLAVALADRRRRVQFGGPLRLTLSVIIESLFSILIAPIMMALHSRFVLSVLAGRNSGWGPQRRDAGRVRWYDAMRAHGGESLAALALGVLLLLELPQLAWWLLPVVLGLFLSVPISVLSSRVGPGRLLRRLGLALVPSEVSPPRELVELEGLLSHGPPDQGPPPIAAQMAARGRAMPVVPPGEWQPGADAAPPVPAWLRRQRNVG